MIYFFCSAATPLYKRDALEVLAYPNEHLYRFRYDQRYVQPEVVPASEQEGEHHSGCLVFVDTIGAPGRQDFDFFPLRRVTRVRLSRKANAIYADFRVGEFVNYGSDDSRQDTWNAFFRSLAARPWPPPDKSGRPSGQQGYFVLAAGELPSMVTGSDVPYGDWHSVVRTLDETFDLAESTFYLMLGFYRVRRRFWLIGREQEVPLGSEDNGYDSVYPVPMGTSVVLKVLLARPKIDYQHADSRRRLSIVGGGEAFSGLSKNFIYSESRYNEDRTILVCKRVFDTAISTVSIREEPDPAHVRTPQTTFVTRVRVPRWIVGIVVGGVALSALLLGLDADTVRFFSGFISGTWRETVEDNAKAIAAIAKMLSSVPVAVSAYLAFKRLPLK